MSVGQKVFFNFEITSDSHLMSKYMERGGYQARKKALAMTSEEIINEVTIADVQGRGGAAFPMGKKWAAIDLKSEKPIYLVINADEGEPGTFKDRWILENNPHQLVEAIIITCHAIKAKHAFVYMRGEFDLPNRRLNYAINEAYEAGFLGNGLDIIVYRGAGAYVCGEASALLNSLEGKKGYPRIRPPRLSVKGLFYCPTIVNNVETLSNVPFIINNGGQAFKDSPTRLYAVSGHINKPGVYEMPFGYSFKKFIYEDCGGVTNGKKLKGIIPGGISTHILTGDEIENLVLEYDSFKKAGSSLGSGGVMVIGEGTCMVKVLQVVLRFFHHESCGQCAPCREGVAWLEKTLNRIASGQGTMKDLDTLMYLSEQIDGTTICALGESAGYSTESIVKKFRHEFEYMIKNGKSMYNGNLEC